MGVGPNGPRDIARLTGRPSYYNLVLATSGGPAELSDRPRSLCLGVAGAVLWLDVFEWRGGEFFRHAIAAYQEVSDMAGVTRATGNLALVFKDMGRLRDAIGQLRRANALSPDRNGEGTRLNNLGNIHRLLGEATALDTQAQVHRDRGDIEHAYELALQAQSLLEESGSPPRYAGEVLTTLGSLHVLMGRPQRHNGRPGAPMPTAPTGRACRCARSRSTAATACRFTVACTGATGHLRHARHPPDARLCAHHPVPHADRADFRRVASIGEHGAAASTLKSFVILDSQGPGLQAA